MPIFLALVALWLFLWDSVTVMTIVTGILIAVVVQRVLYLPPVLFSGRLNLWRALVLGARMIVDVSRASVQIAWFAIDPRWQPSNAIIAVQLHTRSDVVMTLTAEAISVVPGTVVVDIDRERGVLYLHAIGTRTEADVEHVRHGVIGTEERIVLAVGTHEEAERIRAERRARRSAGESASPDSMGTPLPPGAGRHRKEDEG
nr:Na+/H+ antiporter subunit E [Agromyces seonyuensis]